MKFLPKDPQSSILKDGLIYKEGQTEKNRTLRERLVNEQKQFCAYTEQRITVDSSDVEHFDASKKGNDDYYNYYASTHQANKAKNIKDRQKNSRFTNASFFKSLFFQSKTELETRIKYADGRYSPIDPDDSEARDLIEYLSFNDEWLLRTRRRYIAMLRGIFRNAQYDINQQKEFLLDHVEPLQFITAIEHEFGLDLSEAYQ